MVRLAVQKSGHCFAKRRATRALQDNFEIQGPGRASGPGAVLVTPLARQPSQLVGVCKLTKNRFVPDRGEIAHRELKRTIQPVGFEARVNILRHKPKLEVEASDHSPVNPRDRS